MSIGRAEASYSAGGYSSSYYLETLNDTLAYDIQLLRRANWVDAGTRAVDVNLLFYAPGADRFVGVQFLFEVLPTGKVVPRARVAAFRPTQSET